MTTILRIAFWLCIALAIVSLHRPAHAFDKQQATACYPDAVRLCGAPKNYRRWYGLSKDRKAAIVTCMVAHAFSLSHECLSGFGR